MADITFDCPHCGKGLDVDEEGAGLEVPCPSCGEPITIPYPEGFTPPDVAEGAPAQEPADGGEIAAAPHEVSETPAEAAPHGDAKPEAPAKPAAAPALPAPSPEKAKDAAPAPAEVVPAMPAVAPAPVHLYVPDKKKNAADRKPRGASKSGMANVADIEYKPSKMGLVAKLWIGGLVAFCVVCFFVSNNMVKPGVHGVSRKYNLPLGAMDGRFLHSFVPFQLEIEFPAAKIMLTQEQFAKMLVDLAAGTAVHPVQQVFKLPSVEVNYYSVILAKGGERVYSLPGSKWRMLSEMKDDTTAEVLEFVASNLFTPRGVPVIPITTDSTGFKSIAEEKIYELRSAFTMVKEPPPKKPEPPTPAAEAFGTEPSAETEPKPPKPTPESIVMPTPDEAPSATTPPNP